MTDEHIKARMFLCPQFFQLFTSNLQKQYHTTLVISHIKHMARSIHRFQASPQVLMATQTNNHNYLWIRTHGVSTMCYLLLHGAPLNMFVNHDHLSQ